MTKISARADLSGPAAHAGADVWLPTPFTAIVELDDPKCVLELDIHVREVVGPECVAIRRVDGPITATMLRAIALDRWIREAASLVAWVVEADGSMTPLAVVEPAASKLDASIRARGELGRWKLTDEFLADVASVYRRAQAARQRPVAAVVDHFGVPRPTAARWLAEARRRKVGGRRILEPPKKKTTTKKKGSR